MSWDDPNAPRPEQNECPWCDGSGHYACTPSTNAAMIGHGGEHRTHRNAFAHRCGQCGGTGIARVVALR